MVMAGTLISIKCRMLLPREVTEEGEEEDRRRGTGASASGIQYVHTISYELRDRMAEAAKNYISCQLFPRKFCPTGNQWTQKTCWMD